MQVLPQGMKVVEQVSLIFTETIGGWAYWISLLVFTASSGRIGVDFLSQLGVKSLDEPGARLRLMRILQIAFPFCWLLGTLTLPGKPLALVLLGANANNLLLIPLAYGVLHLAMRSRGEERPPLWNELGLLFTIWAIINFTAISYYLKGGL